MDISLNIRAELEALADPAYRAFHAKLIPTVDPTRILGVRTPELRRFAVRLAKTPMAAEFLQELPHATYDEDNLHAFLLERFTDFDALIAALDRFLPYVDNWATCDMMRPKLFTRKREALLPVIMRWLTSTHVYTVRFAIEMLMCHYLDDAFSVEFPRMVAAVDDTEYYVHMMVAWYFATALAMQYDAILPYFETPRLSPQTHNKALQKALESHRLSSEQKAYLRTLKI
ncbi:MAG: DNA alkylation repair protein [Clostridia bacterium]|nr:DNA alkylation repair protein [Clostridia bacterium]